MGRPLKQLEQEIEQLRKEIRQKEIENFELQDVIRELRYVLRTKEEN